MQVTIIAVIASVGMALVTWPQSALTQSDRDFMFVDEDGHLVLRFAGTGAGDIHSAHIAEVSSQEFSAMVHDRLRADLIFEDEPRDPDWDASMEPQIRHHLADIESEFSDIFIQCRAASCRVIMEQDAHWSVPEHLEVLEMAQGSLEAFIADRRQQFEPAFMITAYYQASRKSHIKAFLRRAGADSR